MNFLLNVEIVEAGVPGMGCLDLREIDEVTNA